jgi:hypothetical protein
MWKVEGRGLRKTITVLAIASVAAGGLYFTRSQWLPALGQAVVSVPADAGPPVRADAVLIPAADDVCNEMCTEVLSQAASLTEAGCAESLFMSCGEAYGISDCELAQTTLEKLGQKVAIRPVRMSLRPDKEEAELALRELKRAGVGKVIALVPNYKTRRLGARYRALATTYGMEVRILPSACKLFDVRDWWKTRGSQKLIAFELSRRVWGF